MRKVSQIISDINNTDINNKECIEKLTGELYEYITDKLKKKAKYREPSVTTEGIRNILHTISVIPDEIKQMIWLKKLALEYELSENLLLKELNIIRKKKRKWAERKARVDRKK